MEKKELLCVGNAIVDVFADVDRGFFDSMGIGEPVQHIAPEQAQWILRRLNKPVYRSGGGAANVAKIAAALNTAVVFSGGTGNDALGAYFENELRSSAVVPMLTKSKTPTGLCLILNNGDETRIAASPSAALEFRETHLNEEAFDRAGAVVLDGHILDRAPLVSRIFYLAAARNLPVALDIASVPTAREMAGEIRHYCRIFPVMLFMNADECIAFCQSIMLYDTDSSPCTDIEKAQIIINKICPALEKITAGEFPVLVVKLGGYGALAAAGGVIYRAETVMCNFKNTVGAGDAFCAAFLAARFRDKPLPECLAEGNKAAGYFLRTEETRLQAMSAAR